MVASMAAEPLEALFFRMENDRKQVFHKRSYTGLNKIERRAIRAWRYFELTNKSELFDYAVSDAGVPMTARALIPGESGKTDLSGAAGVRKAESPICRQDGKEVRW